jgi:hypothetical protein
MVAQQNILSGNVVTPQTISGYVEQQNTIVAASINNYTTFNPSGEGYIQIYTAEALDKGDPVYIISYDIPSAMVLVGKARSDDPSKMPAVGIVKNNISASSYSSALVKGFVTDYNTEEYLPNDPIYVGPDGGLSKVGGTYRQEVGRVYLSQAGTGIVSVDIGSVSAVEAIPETVVRRDGDGSIFANVVHADGSVIRDHVFPADATFQYQSNAAAAHREALGLGANFAIETPTLINTKDLLSFNGSVWTNVSPETITNGGIF